MRSGLQQVTLTVRLNDGPCDTKQCDWVLTEQAEHATPSANIVVEATSTTVVSTSS